MIQLNLLILQHKKIISKSMDKINNKIMKMKFY